MTGFVLSILLTFGSAPVLTIGPTYTTLAACQHARTEGENYFATHYGSGHYTATCAAVN